MPCARVPQVVKALEWVVEHANAQKPYRPAVVLLSLGGELDGPLDESVRRTTQHGINVVVAAGNSHVNSCTESPSATKEAFVVAASGQFDELTDFSSYGPCVHMVAPGATHTAHRSRSAFRASSAPSVHH